MTTADSRKISPTRAASVLPKVNGNVAVSLTEADIALVAYKRYVARGCAHGHDVDDWVQAERELLGGPNIGPTR